MNASKTIALTEANRAAASKTRAEYMRQWRAKNKEREKATRQRYWTKKAFNLELQKLSQRKED